MCISGAWIFLRCRANLNAGRMRGAPSGGWRFNGNLSALMFKQKNEKPLRMERSRFNHFYFLIYALLVTAVIMFATQGAHQSGDAQKTSVQAK